ncbi:MAG: ROK family protein, partial [Bacteroidales bacterium]|nr:ROK family protein [Bacteroidales bacterium]
VRIPDSISIRFMHDVNAALQGNIRLLDLYGQNVALVTLGTGLGFSYALRGHIFTNEKGSPARGIWNLPYGGGILEDFVSGRGIRVRYSRKTGDATQSALSIAKKAFAGEKAALENYAQTGAILGEALAPILQELKIDALLMGGQISRSLELMKTTLQNALPGMPIIKAPEQAVFTGLGTLFENN